MANNAYISKYTKEDNNIKNDSIVNIRNSYWYNYKYIKDRTKIILKLIKILTTIIIINITIKNLIYNNLNNNKINRFRGYKNNNKTDNTNNK